MHPLESISPIDGRYSAKTESLRKYFSEQAFMRYRILVEVEYFLALSRIPIPQLSDFPIDKANVLQNIYRNFTFEECQEIKKLELKTNHDIKAVEYFLKDKFEKLGFADHLEFIHFGLTSQDINNCAIPKLVNDALNEVYLPTLDEVIQKLNSMAKKWQDVSMLARTHGQPASPTKLGKEIYVFVERIISQLKLLQQIPISAKFGGATGNLNAHSVAYPNINWIEFANRFVNDSLNLSRSQTTTQIEHYDNVAALCDNLKRIHVILIDFCRDMWTYISMNYFSQNINENEVGSSAMPHKVNPIDFENAEGNLGVANALLSHFSEKLPISRLQRDLTDSTVLRNIGVPFAHGMIAMDSILKGLSKISLNEKKLNADLEENWSVVAEAIQTILRREGYPKPYEALKSLTRKNSSLNKKEIHAFIESLKVDDKIKTELKNISPQNYTGITSIPG